MPGLETLAVGTKEIASSLGIMRDFITGRNFYTTINKGKTKFGIKFLVEKS